MVGTLPNCMCVLCWWGDVCVAVGVHTVSHFTADPSNFTILQLMKLSLQEVNLTKVNQVITLKVKLQSQI